MPQVVGPGSIPQETTAPTPTLDGAGEYEYITILNPLTDDFQVMVAQDIPVNMPFTIRDPTSMVKDERDVTMNYGLQLKNPEHTAKKYIYNQAIIPAGKTMNFKGNEAQVVVRQLVNEILQRSGKNRLMADPHLRQQIENDIIIARGSVQDILDSRLVTPREQIETALNQSNEVKDEPFPGLNQTVEDNVATGGESGSSDPAQSKRSPGRPKQS